MNRVSAIGFLVIYLIANTELHQFLRLPVFFEHLREHRQEAPDLDLINFITLHYFSGNPKDADHERDDQLPFNCKDCLAAPITVAILTDISFDRLVVIPAITTPTSIYKSPFCASSVQASIWQPPRA